MKETALNSDINKAVTSVLIIYRDRHNIVIK